jgi:hypothetical protein
VVQESRGIRDLKLAADERASLRGQIGKAGTETPDRPHVVQEVSLSLNRGKHRARRCREDSKEPISLGLHLRPPPDAIASRRIWS